MTNLVFIVGIAAFLLYAFLIVVIPLLSFTMDADGRRNFLHRAIFLSSRFSLGLLIFYGLVFAIDAKSIQGLELALAPILLSGGFALLICVSWLCTFLFKESRRAIISENSAIESRSSHIYKIISIVVALSLPLFLLFVFMGGNLSKIFESLLDGLFLLPLALFYFFTSWLGFIVLGIAVVFVFYKRLSR